MFRDADWKGFAHASLRVRIRWSVDAADDLEAYLPGSWEQKTEAAGQVSRTIYDGCISLKNLPARGRIGREPNSRDLILSPFALDHV